MKRTHDLCASNGEYTSGGVTKKRWQQCGSIFTGDDGRISVKLDAVPVGPEWSGWFSAFPVDRDGGRSRDRQPAGGGRLEALPDPAPDPGADGDDIPF